MDHRSTASSDRALDAKADPQPPGEVAELVGVQATGFLLHLHHRLDRVHGIFLCGHRISLPGDTMGRNLHILRPRRRS